jgi:transposase-like protein
MTRRKQPKPVQQLTVKQFEAMFPDEDACRAYLKARRWPDGVHCPRCGNPHVYELHTRPWHWQCTQCAPGGSTGYRFSILTGTIFENTNKPLRDWFQVAHLMLTAKKGISARQVWRYMGFGSLKTAWYMMHRIRAAIAEAPIEKLGGIVEVDETFIGGKWYNKHKDKRGGGSGGLGSGKSAVIGAISRKGNVVLRVIDRTDTATLDNFVRETVCTKVSLLATDNHSGYRLLRDAYPHGVICHEQGQHVVGALHTNTIEGFWSILKRGVIGTYHNISRKYLPLYVAEFQFRHNNRHNADIFGAAIGRC